MTRIFDSKFDAAHYDDPVFSAHAIMADNQEEANANLATTVKKLGAGYRGRRAWPRRTETRDPAAAAAGEEQDKAESVAAPALRTGFQYRRPPPEPDTDDDNAENPPSSPTRCSSLATATGAAGPGRGAPPPIPTAGRQRHFRRSTGTAAPFHAKTTTTTTISRRRKMPPSPLRSTSWRLA